LILILGGLFLLGKATYEIHDKLEGEEGHGSSRVSATLGAVLVQIILLDIVFSLDSVITAVGMVDELGVMIAAVVIAVGIMMVSAGAISNFVNQHPTLKMLALSFLLLVGFVLVLEGFDQHISKGYIYFAMAFSVFVEFLNIRIYRRRRQKQPVDLHQRYSEQERARASLRGRERLAQARTAPICRGVVCLYSPNFREEAFSETQMHPFACPIPHDLCR
jgi:predicted tellurium resistance membrane protein TerC